MRHPAEASPQQEGGARRLGPGHAPQGPHGGQAEGARRGRPRREQDRRGTLAAGWKERVAWEPGRAGWQFCNVIPNATSTIRAGCGL